MKLLALMATACGLVEPGDEEVDEEAAPACVTTVQKTVSAPTTWGEDCREYSVPDYLSVKAELTIRPGTKVVFGPKAGLEVAPDGSLSAVGTETRPIVFEGAESSKGHWAGIGFLSSSSKNELTWARVSGGGAKDGGHHFRTYSVLAAGRAKITNTIIENSANDALVVDKGADIAGFSNNTFRGIEGFPITLYFSGVGHLDGESSYAGSTSAPNNKPFIKVAADKAKSSQTWHAQDVPYRLSGTLAIDDADTVVTIAPGAQLHFEEGAGVDVATGALSAVGTEAAPVVFRGVDESKSFWAGIAFRSNSSKNELTWVRLSDAGKKDAGHNFRTYSILVTGAARVKITDTQVSQTGANALVVDKGGNIEGYARNRFSGIDGFPVELGANAVGDLDGESDYTGGSGAQNAKPWLLVNFENVTRTQTWRKQSVPYRFKGTTSINDAGATVTVEPGARLEFEGEARLDVAQGSLVAEGTEQAPIVFTGVDRSKGFWSGLTFQSTGANRLAHAEVSYAGASGYLHTHQGIRVIGRLSLTNSTVKENREKGVRVLKGASFDESDNVFKNNGPNNAAADDLEDNR